MGLDYSYVLVINKYKKDELINFVKKNGEVNGSDCFCMNFEVDSFILKYLEGGYDWKPHYDKEEIHQHLTSDNKAKIGCIYYTEVKATNPEELIVSFTAATSDMSRLFQDSIAVKNWFIALSKKVNSIITYVDLEAEGHRIIYLNGNETFLEFKGEGFFSVKKNSFLGIMDEFGKHLPYILTSYYETNYKFEEKYSIVVQKDNIDKLRSYIERNGSFDHGQAVLYFDLDSTLFKYLEDGYGEQEYGIPQGIIRQFRKDIVYKHIGTNNKVKLGKIDYREEDIKGDKENLIVSFTPMKWRVDQLFSESLSIRNWFIELSKEASAKMTFQSIWNQGYGHRIIYYQKAQTNVEFTGHYDLEISTFINIYRVFSMYLMHFEE